METQLNNTIFSDGINVLSLFDGMACGMLAMQKAGVKVKNYYAYEIDKYAIQTATHNFPDIKELGDVFDEDFSKYENIDFLIGGSPCVPAGSKIKTDKGYKNIEDMCIGDMVLTHKNRYKPVLRLYERKTNNLYHLKFNGNVTLDITGNHPIYTYRNNKFEFVRTDELTTNDYITININQNSDALTYSDDILWLAGRALADGYLSAEKNAVIISVGKSKIEEFINHLRDMSYYVTRKDRATLEYVINNIGLTELYSYFGNNKALDKFIPDTILNLPKNQLKIVFDGYISGDGFIRKDKPNTVMWCSSSNNLILSMGLLTAKLFNKYPTTTMRLGEYKKLPSGMCQTHDSYNSQISITDRHNSDVKVVGDKILIRIKSIEKEDLDINVYNIETAEDHSYTVNNCIVHNCTYWSIAQSPDKRETTASGLGWKLFNQYVRAIKEAKPKYFIYENNKSMAKNIYKSISESFGFEPIMINSALVSAQNRQRYYWVGKRSKDGTYSKVDIEQPKDRGISLKDVLDGVVDRKKSRAIIASIGRTTTREYFEKNQGQMSCEPVAFSMVGDLTNRRVGTKDKAYCLAANPSSDMSARVIEPVACRCRGRKDENGNGCAKYECRNDCKSNTLDTNSTNGNMIAEPVDKPIRVGAYPTSDGRMLNSQGMRIYSIDGKSVTQSAQGGGMGAKTGLYAVPVEFGRGIPTKAISCADGKTYKVHEVKNGLITIKEKQYPIKLQDGHYIIRKLTVSECKRLQTVPEWYEFQWMQQHEQRFGKEVEICNYAKLKAAINLLQTEKLNFAISTNYDLSDMVQPNSQGQLLTIRKNVKRKDATDNSKQLWVTVCCTTKGGNENNPLTKQKSALYVMNSWDTTDATRCALNITLSGCDTETLYIPRNENLNLMEILNVNTSKQVTEDGFIELLQKKCLEEISAQKKLFIISTLISWIILRTIYMCATIKPTSLYIDSLNDWQYHSLTMELSSLKMGSIGGVSNSAAYKMLGNGWTIEVIKHILNGLK